MTSVNLSVNEVPAKVPEAKVYEGRSDALLAAKDMRAMLLVEMPELKTEVRTWRADRKFVVRFVGGWADDCRNLAHDLCEMICNAFNDNADARWSFVVYVDRF